MIDVNERIVLLIADRMEASCSKLKRLTDDFQKQWGAFRGSFDDMTKEKIDRAITSASRDIKDTVEQQKASSLIRSYVETLRGK